MTDSEFNEKIALLQGWKKSDYYAVCNGAKEDLWTAPDGEDGLECPDYLHNILWAMSLLPDENSWTIDNSPYGERKFRVRIHIRNCDEVEVWDADLCRAVSRAYDEYVTA